MCDTYPVGQSGTRFGSFFALLANLEMITLCTSLHALVLYVHSVIILRRTLYFQGLQNRETTQLRETA